MTTNEIINKLGIRLNEMQQAASKAIINGTNDIVILSPTGTGKTYAYLIPLASQLDASDENLQAIVLLPGRELALQSAGVLKNMGSGLRTMALYGGRSTMDEHRQLRSVRPQIVFATPGRLNDHIDKDNLDVSHVRTLVIDEFDKMLEMGFQEEMSAIISKLPNVKRHILLSATDAEEIPDYMRGIEPERLDFLPKTESEKRIRVYKVDSPDKDKLATLSRLLMTLGESSSIVFLNYRDSVERTAAFLADKGFTVSLFHGGLDQQDRERALYRFSNGTANILVCTDLASRGLDIPDIANIIHYHIPETQDAYIHRIGRTARWDRKGQTFFLLGPGENIPDYVTADDSSSDGNHGYSVEEFKLNGDDGSLKVPQPLMTTIYIGKGKRDKISKGDILGFLCKKGGLKGKEIGRIDVFERYAYAAIPRRSLRQVLRMTHNEKIKGLRTVVEEVRA